MVRSRAPPRYIAQLGRVNWATSGGDDGCGDGDDGCGDGEADSSGGSDGSDGGDSVVKAPTALQALWLLELLALTFQ